MRTERKRSEETKRKISETMKGRKRTEDEKKKISDGMKRYWESIPYENKNETLTTNEETDNR